MSAGPVHKPGTFNIEAYSGGRWLGGMNRLTREAAIAAARTWAAQDGSRHRVFDLDGKVIFDTDAAPVDALAVLRSHRDACRIQGCAWCVELDQVIAGLAELIEADKEYDAALCEFSNGPRPDLSPDSMDEWADEWTKVAQRADLHDRLQSAKARRAAALARVGGAS